MRVTGTQERGRRVTPAAPLRVLVVDDDPVYRAGLRAVIAGQPDLLMVGEASSAREAFPLLGQAPDVLLLDLLLPGMDGISALTEIKLRAPKLRIVMLSALAEARDVQEALAAGVAAFVGKTVSVQVLLSTLRGAGMDAGAPAPADELRRHHPGPGSVQSLAAIATLTTREREVFSLVVRGFQTERIARELCIAKKTVDTHRQRIYDKLDIHSAGAMVDFAARNGLLRIHPRGSTVEPGGLGEPSRWGGTSAEPGPRLELPLGVLLGASALLHDELDPSAALATIARSVVPELAQACVFVGPGGARVSYPAPAGPGGRDPDAPDLALALRGAPGGVMHVWTTARGAEVPLLWEALANLAAGILARARG